MPLYDYEAIALHVPFVSFATENENALIARKKGILNLMQVSQLICQKP